MIVVGSNFRFGHEQKGTTEALVEMAKQEGFRVEVLPMLEFRGEPVSSSRIRQALSEGRVERAARLLGRRFSNSGTVTINVGRRKVQPWATRAS